jgi:putative acyl-CoA dehydrogenase
MSTSEFFQEGPRLKNQFLSDPWLNIHLSSVVPSEVFQKWKPHLQEVGEDAAGKLLVWADEAERDEPRHIPYDPWGKRVDRIEVSRAWIDMKNYAAEHGLIAEGYERKDGPWSRLYQMSLLYLYHPSSAIFSCPLAMTDGAARAIEIYGDEELKKTAFRHLTSRDPKTFWTSGQWMTERTGGSDVGQSLTKAVKNGDHYALHGEKWFTSATTSEMSMALARIEGAEAGGKGLSLFYVKVHDDQGQLRGIRVRRLKNKMGTKALPTAELELVGTPAHLVGGEGGGVKKIAALFNISRIYNSVAALGYMRRALALALDYSQKRHVFGRKLKDQPLHLATLFPVFAETWGCSDLVFELIRLLGREECNEATENEKALLRLFIPLAKLYTGKKVVSVVFECIEMFGGAGYVEDTGLPTLLKNAQVLPIWEGTTNVLSLDMLRALTKECPLSVWAEDQGLKIKALGDAQPASHLKTHLDQILKAAGELAKDSERMSFHAREFAFALTELSIATLVCGKARKNPTPQTKAVADFWLRRLRPFEAQPADSQMKAHSVLF